MLCLLGEEDGGVGGAGVLRFRFGVDANTGASGPDETVEGRVIICWT